MDMGIGILFN